MVLNPRCEVWKYFDNIIEEGVAVCKLCKQRLKNERSYSLRKHITKLHNPKSEIWKYFDNIVNECVAVCKICNKRVRNNRHFNLTLHLKQHEIFLDADNDVEKTNNEPPTKPIERAKYYLCVEMEEETFVDAVMGLLIDERVAPQTIDSKHMQSLLSPVCEALSKREKIKLNVDRKQSEKVICSLASYIRDEFGNDLHWRLLSLKIDMDLNDTSKSFCLSAQFTDNNQIESRALGIITLDDGQQLTRQSIVEILHKFSIDPNQIVSACWDNTKPNYNRSVSNSEYLKEMEKFEKNYEIYVGDIKVERYIGVIAQLCILDILKNSRIYELFLECRNLTKFIKANPYIFSEEFERNNLKVPELDSPWKWGSTYNMMNDLKESYHVLKNINFTKPEYLQDQFELNDNLKNFIDGFCKSLNFMQKALLKFYTEDLNFGDFYVQWLKCKILTEKSLESNTNQGSHLEFISSELVKCMESRSNELLNQDRFKACLYLDPRFQHTINLPEKMFVLEYLNQLWKLSKMYNADLVDPATDSKQKPVIFPLNDEDYDIYDGDDDDDDNENSALNQFLCQGANEMESRGIYKKLEDLKLPFQMANTNILKFWKDFKFKEPEIYILAATCFAMPATQNYEKTRYSHLSRKKDSKNLSPEHKENLTLIRLNEHLLHKAKEALKLFREDDDPSDIDISDENSNSARPLTTSGVSVPTVSSIPDSLPSTSTGDVDITIVKSEIDELIDI